MKKHFQLLFALLFSMSVLLFMNGQVSAQGTTTAAVQGVVKNNHDEPMPGASVTVTYAATGSRYQAKTSEKGTFYLQNLPVGGPYRIEVSFIGYRNFVDDKVYLSLGQAYNVKVYMSEEKGQLQQVEVKGNRRSSPHDATKTGASQQISRSQLDRMPTLNRSLSDFTRLVPQSSGLSFGGRNNRYNNIQIDGSQNNDIMGYGVGGGVTTGAPGGQAGTQPISLDAIDEIQVVLAPFDVKQGSFTGAGINAVTRRGTNTFTGSVYAYGKNQGLVGLSPDNNRQRFNTFQDGQLGFRLGGPIIKNKLFFFVNGESSYRNEPLLYRAGRGKGTADESTISYAMAQQLADTLRARFGYEPGKFEDISKVTSSNKFFIRFDYAINDRNRLTLRHNFVNARRDDITNGVNALRFENNKYVQTNRTNVTVAELNTYFSDKLSNNLIIGYTNVRDNREIPGSPFPQVTIQAGAAGTIAVGTEGYSPSAKQQQDLIQLTDNLSWLKDKHHFTFGTQNEFFRFNNLFLQNIWGNYQYSSLDAFLNNQAPTLYQLTYSKLPGVAVPTSVFRSLQLGFYAQDEYSVTEGLKVTAGLRADIPVFLDSPLDNAQVAAGFAKEGYRTGMRPKTRVLLSPRLGFNWDVRKDGGTIIRGGTGVFTGRLPYVWLANAYNNTGVDLGRINATGAATANVRFSGDVYNQPKPNAIATSEIDLTDPNFRMPQVWRTSLAIDQRLPWNITGTLEAIYSKDINAPYIQDLNLVEPTGKLGGDGRDLYPAGNARLRFPEFTNVFMLTNTNKGYQYSLTAKLERNVEKGVSASAAYTYGQAKDISSMNSTIASTNFRNNTIANNPNLPRLTYSDWNLDHRIVATVSYRVTYLKHLATTIGLVYNGQSGLPYTYRVNSDINGDGQTQNDAMYIPKDINDIVLVPNNAQDKRTPQEIYEQLNSFVEQDPYLRKHRGEYAERNAARTPWTHIVDLHLAQDVLLKLGNKTHALQVAFDVFNFTNMLNRNWGLVKLPSITTTQLPATLSGAILIYKGMETPGTPGGVSRPMYSYVPVNGSFINAPVESRWRGQLSVRYSF
ncbi:carboxypeptidase regulatory-like domain-containing protein [Chitinophaga pendula]|uniref:TonB-dependent receptor n=1 Tax=Chitinophaga TaxID=79328 RepID=UPI000BAF685D|nr:MULTISPECIES: carboxypeptidase regulatory-like domain-containing protein [Chitinophaga]ASZ11683.1 hypothetical protein CK934_12280 [Chitinophaga sp. MD30]UCJ05304.1 carboxypeptidase regulatory-like domain-containing protein [Chitinophaga pendula]